MTTAARTAVATLVAVAAALPLQAATRRGSVAFHYGPALTAAQLAWFANFDVLITHDPLPRAQVDALHRSGTRLAIYEWSVAFYRTLVRRGSFEERMLANRAALLNEQPLRGGSGADDADAFYYDPATDAHTNERPRAIAARLKEIGYDGVFLDTVGFEHVHPSALAEFKRRHGDLAYDKAFSRFMRALRAELKLVITNQGYRLADDYLPFVDYDVSESQITAGNRMRPWNDPRDPWNSIDVLMRRVTLPAARRYPRVRFVHLNYASDAYTTPIVAIARLYGQDAFVAQSDVTSTAREHAYFVDLGKPRGAIVRRGNTAVREFANGMIAVNASDVPMTIEVRKAMVNVATGASVVGRVRIAPYSVAMLARP